MRIIYTLLTLLIASVTIAQNETPKNFAETITADNLKKHLYILASPEMEGRETTKEGQRKAAAYIENHFKTLGLKSPASLNGYQQSYTMQTDSLLFTSFKLNKKKLIWGKDYLMPANANEDGTINGSEIIFAGYGISTKSYDDYSNLNVKGKIVVFVNGEPKKDSIYYISGNKQYSKLWTVRVSTKLENAFKHGAKGALIINPGAESINSSTAEESKISKIYLPSHEKTVNGINISHNLGILILGKKQFEKVIEKAKKQEVFIKQDYISGKNNLLASYKEQKKLSYSTNVLGVLEGTDKKQEYVFVTAHYDHLGIVNGELRPGADDDASGTTAVLEIAEAFAKAAETGIRPRRTIVFMTVSGEEKGLWGSEYYSNNPVFPLNKTSVDLNIDMIGRIDEKRNDGDSTNYVYVIGDDKLSSELSPVTDTVNKTYVNLELDRKFNDPNDPNRFYYRSDHFNFAEKGVPVIFYFDNMQTDYHRKSDTPDKINYTLQAKRAQLVFYTAWDMANRDNMMKRDIPLN
ncbi:MAG: M28 family peptidase [Sphingobacteriales bacterium]